MHGEIVVFRATSVEAVLAVVYKVEEEKRKRRRAFLRILLCGFEFDSRTPVPKGCNGSDQHPGNVGTWRRLRKDEDPAGLLANGVF